MTKEEKLQKLNILFKHIREYQNVQKNGTA